MQMTFFLPVLQIHVCVGGLTIETERERERERERETADRIVSAAATTCEHRTSSLCPPPPPPPPPPPLLLPPPPAMNQSSFSLFRLPMPITRIVIVVFLRFVHMGRPPPPPPLSSFPYSSNLQFNNLIWKGTSTLPAVKYKKGFLLCVQYFLDFGQPFSLFFLPPRLFSYLILH